MAIEAGLLVAVTAVGGATVSAYTGERFDPDISNVNAVVPKVSLIFLILLTVGAVLSFA